MNNDSLHGYIDYRNWERTPGKIYFKEKLTNERTSYTPVDIKSFGVLDELYESAIVNTEISPINTSNLTFDAKPNFQIDTCFLQTMIRGKKSLYFYTNDYGREQLYIKLDSSYELLVYKKYLRKLPQSDIIIENKTYTGQLAVYLQDCPNIQPKITSLKYTKQSIEKLFIFYYGCVPSGINFQKTTEKTTLELGVLAGVSLTSLKFKSTAFAYLVNANFSNSANISAGLFLDVILPRNERRLSIYNELIYSTYNFDVYANSNSYTIVETKMGYSFLKLNNMFRYKYPIANVFLYANAGISNALAFNETNNRKEVSTLYGTETGRAIDETKKTEFGILIGLGAKYKQYSFEIRYEQGDGMSKYTGLASITNRYYFMFGYRF